MIFSLFLFDNGNAMLFCIFDKGIVPIGFLF